MSSEDPINVIDCFDKATILVIGDLMLDRYLHGTVTRISPEAPVPLMEISSEHFRLGGAANAINTIRSLGGHVIAVGVVGDDWFGKRLIGLLKRETVDTTCVIEINERPTTVKTRVLAGQYQVIRLDRESKASIDDRHCTTLLDFIRSRIEQVDAVLISDYNKGVVTDRLMRGSIDLAKKFNKPIILYPKIDPSLDYTGVTAVITDREKASSITGIRQINETSIRNMGHWLLTHLGCESVLITRGNEGLSLFETNDMVTHIPSTARGVHNVTGLVDAVSSTITLSLVSGCSCMADAARLAGTAAGIAAEKRDAATLLRDELIHQAGIREAGKK